MEYRPNQAHPNLLLDLRNQTSYLGNAGPYTNWDVLVTDTKGIFTIYTPGDFLHIELNRSATVVVAQRAGNPSNRPAWLNDWELGTPITVIINGNTSGAVTYTKVLPAGEHNLGVPGSQGDPYFLLLGEADGTPSSPPSVPTGLESPQPNQYCPAWIHDQHVTEGPEGRMYRTWHPQIDPVYWCYFGHEHGSDPIEFGDGTFHPKYNQYTHLNGRFEPHGGFKGVLLRDENDREAYITQHFTTSDLNRACSRFHATDIAFADSDGTLVGDLNLKGDFGVPYAVEAGGPFFRMRPSACPEVGDLEGVSGKRLIAVNMPGTGYESWQWNPYTTVFPIVLSFVITTHNPMTRCAFGDMNADGTYRCDPPAGSGYSPAHHLGATQDGSMRWLIFPAQRNFGFDTRSSSVPQGSFCTDWKGWELLDCGDPQAVEQYLKPGVLFTLSNGPVAAPAPANKWQVLEPWRAVYVNPGPALAAVDRNLEDHIIVPTEN